ncbi:hypothetical protein KFS98_003531 [Salmonella enterica]|nr:hypothetical protein [Salmonella enterica]
MDSTINSTRFSNQIHVFQAYSALVQLLKSAGQVLSNSHILLPLAKNKLMLSLDVLNDADRKAVFAFFHETSAITFTDSHLILDIADCQETEIVATVYNNDANSPVAITLSGLTTSKEVVWLGLKNCLAVNYNSLDSKKPTYITVGTPKNLLDITDKNVLCFPSLDFIQQYSDLSALFDSHEFNTGHITVLLNKGHFNSAGSLFKIQHSLVIPGSDSFSVYVSKGDILFDQGFDSEGNFIPQMYYAESTPLLGHKFITSCDNTQEHLSDYLSTLFDIKHLARMNDCKLMNIDSLADIKLEGLSDMPFVVDCSPTGTGKSTDLINQVEAYLDGAESAFAADKRIIIVVPNFNNIPAKLLLRDEVVLSWGRQSENFAVTSAGGHYSFKRASQLENSDSIVKIFEANCGDQQISQKGHCSGCGKPKDECEYNKHVKLAKEGFPDHKVIITTMGNSDNLFGKLLPVGEKFQIVEDDLNFINDSHQIHISSNDSWLYRLANRYHQYGVDIEADLVQATLESLVYSLTENKFQVTQEAFDKNQRYSLPDREDVLESVTESENSLTFEQAVKIVNTTPKTEMDETIYHNSEVSEIRKLRDRSLDILKAYYPLINSAYFDTLDWKKLHSLCRNQWVMLKVMEAVYKPAYENLASSQKMSKARGFYQFNTTVRLKSRSSKFFLGSAADNDNDLVTFPVFAALNETVITINMSKTLPERYETFAASLLRISADDFFESYHTVGKKPDMVIYRSSDYKPTLIRTSNNNYERSLGQLPPNAALPYITRNVNEELSLKLGALQVMHPEIEIPENIRHVIFDVKETKQKVARVLENKHIEDLAFKQYFGDEVGSNELYSKEFNCATLRATKTQNISSLLLFQGRDCGTFIRKININFGTAEKPRFEKVTIINDGINLARQNIMLNQAYGRLRANRQGAALAFIAQGEFVNLNNANVIDIDMAEAVTFDIQLKQRTYESKAEQNSELVAESNMYIALDAMSHTQEESLTWLDWTKEFKKYGKTSGYAEITELFADSLDMRKRIKLSKAQVMEAVLKLVAYYIIWQQRKTININVLTENKLNSRINNPVSVIQSLKAHQAILQAFIDDLEPKFMEWYPENYIEPEILEGSIDDSWKMPNYLKGEVFPEDAIQAYSFAHTIEAEHLVLEDSGTFNLQSIWRSEVAESKAGKMKDFLKHLKECAPANVPFESIIPLTKAKYNKLYRAMFDYEAALKRNCSDAELELIRNNTASKIQEII